MAEIDIKVIKPNPNNPRIIKDEKFKKLVQSLKELPEMAKVRPIVVNQDMIVLGGNMRLKAMQEAGWKKVPVEVVDWEEEKQRQFIIKDNVGFGEWDWEQLANQWDSEQLSEWGLDLPEWSKGIPENEMNEDDLDLTEEFDPIGLSKDLQKVVFVFANKQDAETWLNKNQIDYKRNSMVWQVDMNTQSI